MRDFVRVAEAKTYTKSLQLVHILAAIADCLDHLVVKLFILPAESSLDAFVDVSPGKSLPRIILNISNKDFSKPIFEEGNKDNRFEATLPYYLRECNTHIK